MKNNYKSIFELEGKTAVVTGSGGGIGRAIACVLADFGADVMCASHNPQKAKKTAQLVCEYGRKGISLGFDISDVEEIRAFKQETLGEFGRVDILVNSAGMNRRDFITDIKEEDFLRILDVNLKGVLFCCQAFGEEMVQHWEKVTPPVLPIRPFPTSLKNPVKSLQSGLKVNTGPLIDIFRSTMAEKSMI